MFHHPQTCIFQMKGKVGKDGNRREEKCFVKNISMDFSNYRII